MSSKATRSYFISLTSRSFSVGRRATQGHPTLRPGDVLGLVEEYGGGQRLALHLVVAAGPRVGYEHLFKIGSDRIRPASPLDLLAGQAK